MLWLLLSITLLVNADAEALYRNATTHAEQGEAEQALKLLQRAVENGLSDPHRVLSDPAWQGFRESRSLKPILKNGAQTSSVRIVPDDAAGTPLHISARVVDARGEPLGGCSVYLYHTDAGGLYSSTGANNEATRGYFAYLQTDTDGRFAVHTIRPAGYPGGNVPQHVHYEITLPTGGRHVAEFLFDDDPRLGQSTRDSARRRGWPIVTTRKSSQGETVDVLIQIP